MNPRDIARARACSQLLAGPRFLAPGEVVSHFGGMQAQDYLQALWSMGVRLPTGTTEMVIEQAIADRQIVRTWPMRGTLHFVSAADVRWMLELLTPRIIAGSALRQRQLELDAGVFAQCEKLFLKSLRGGKVLTREALLDLLEKAQITTTGQRGYHILWRLSQEGLLCLGPRQGKSQSFVLLDEWLPEFPKMTREASLAELAKRYFLSRGPATLADFAGWAGLKLSDARAGLEAVAPLLVKVEAAGEACWMSAAGPPVEGGKEKRVHLLPGFDEMILGYKDRSAVLDPEYSGRIVPGGNGVFFPTMMMNGRVVGTWKRLLKKKQVQLDLQPFVPLKPAELRAFTAAAEQYGKFLGLPMEMGKEG